MWRRPRGRPQLPWLEQVDESGQELLRMGRGPAWRLARRNPRVWRRRVGDATRPPAYAPFDWLYDSYSNTDFGVFVFVFEYFVNRNQNILIRIRILGKSICIHRIMWRIIASPLFFFMDRRVAVPYDFSFVVDDVFRFGTRRVTYRFAWPGEGLSRGQGVTQLSQFNGDLVMCTVGVSMDSLFSTVGLAPSWISDVQCFGIFEVTVNSSSL